MRDWSLEIYTTTEGLDSTPPLPTGGISRSSTVFLKQLDLQSADSSRSMNKNTTYR